MIIFLLALLFMDSQAWGETIPIPIRILGARGGVMIVRDLGTQELSTGWTKIQSKPPHRQLNPDHQVFTFEGVPVKRLLRDFKMEHVTHIYAIGSDGYISMIPKSLVEDYSTLLAFKRDGAFLPRAQGEQQLIFPTEGAQPVPSAFAQKAAFWNWYVRALVVGDLPNSLLRDNRPSHLSSAAGEVSVEFVAPPAFSFDLHPCPKAREVLLKDAPLQFRMLSGGIFDPGKGSIPTEYRILMA